MCRMTAGKKAGVFNSELFVCHTGLFFPGAFWWDFGLSLFVRLVCFVSFLGGLLLLACVLWCVLALELAWQWHTAALYHRSSSWLCF